MQSPRSASDRRSSISPRPVAAALAAAVALAAVPASARPGPSSGGGETSDPRGPVVIGVGHAVRIVPRPAEAYPAERRWTWTRALACPDAGFLKAHLANVDLRPGDRLLVRDGAGRVVDEITGRGPKDAGSFWALSAFGDTLLLELDFASPYRRPPFVIDNVILGDPVPLGPDLGADGARSICAPEDFDDVICYQADAAKWKNVLATAGVMTIGSNPNNLALFCTGSNVSADNYVLTNQHCIEDQNDCDATEFVFKFWRTACNSGAPTTTDWHSYRCDDIVASSPFALCEPTAGTLDYSLCSVIGDPNGLFGHVDPDPVALTDGEAVYLVQHPNFRPMEITHGSGASVDADGLVIRYYDTLDTEGGSSGAPMFRESDDKMVAVHHCEGCATPGVGNRGISMASIYPAIQSFLCAPGLDVEVQTPVEIEPVHGNADPFVDPGEIWQFRPRVLNRSCSQTAIDVTAQVQPSSGFQAQIQIFDPIVEFGSIDGGVIQESSAPVRFRVNPAVACGTPFSFDLVAVQAANGGPFDDKPAVVGGTVGHRPVDVVLYQGFDSLDDWFVLNGGTGGGPASTWSLQNPGGRFLSLASPFFICDSEALGPGQTMDEQLVSGIYDTTAYSNVQLQFRHDFKWDPAGMPEKGDVEIRSNKTNGAWIKYAQYTNEDSFGLQTLDVSNTAAHAFNVQVRFRYYDAQWELWWAVDDVYLLGSNGFECHPIPVLLQPGGGGFSGAIKR